MHSPLDFDPPAASQAPMKLRCNSSGNSRLDASPGSTGLLAGFVACEVVCGSGPWALGVPWVLVCEGVPPVCGPLDPVLWVAG
jgi:hypothetical protein